MDKGLRGRWKNTPSHLSLILEGYFWSCRLKVNISHASVMFVIEVLGEVFGKVFSSLLSVEAKLFLLGATPHPVEAHVKFFGLFPAYVAGEDAVGGFVVIFDWGGRLWMAHFNQGCAYGNILLAVEEDCTGFSLGGVCHDSADSMALGEDWAVWNGSRSDGGRGGVSLR